MVLVTERKYLNGLTKDFTFDDLAVGTDHQINHETYGRASRIIYMYWSRLFLPMLIRPFQSLKLKTLWTQYKPNDIKSMYRLLGFFLLQSLSNFSLPVMPALPNLHR